MPTAQKLQLQSILSLDKEEAREVYSVTYTTELLTQYKLKRRSKRK